MNSADAMSSNSVRGLVFSTATVRDRANKIAQLAKNGGTHFEIDESRLEWTAEFVLQVMRENYPDLEVPYHSRWRHFEIGNRHQLQKLNAHLEPFDSLERTRLGLDLIIPSVLLDAGAGGHWLYHSENSVSVGRSEGLGLASLDMFLDGGFSSSGYPGTDAKGLSRVTTEDFCRAFKVTDKNPMRGVEGRVALLGSLAKALLEKGNFFPNQRPGDLADYLLNNYGNRFQAQNVLQLVINAFGDIWPSRLQIEGINLGDAWQYAPLGDGIEGLIPFHKLSQWLTYSIIETLENNGFTVTDLDAMTGLAEYRNGGLLIDAGVLLLRNPSDATQQWQPSSELIVEWRALTIHYLDIIASKIRERLKLDHDRLPLAKVLEGGTWAAGRKLAAEKRSDMSPPINIVSDGTVF